MDETAEFRIDLDEEFPHLSAAPIVEAVIHWIAKPSQPLVADDFRRRLEERLKSAYPKVQAQNHLRLIAQVDADAFSTQQRSSWLGFRLESEDGLCIAQFNQDGLVYSRLKPYEDWERFSAEGKRLWKVFCELAGISEVQRLAVRFINRIALQSLSDVAKFLKRPPQCLKRLGLPQSNFFFASKHDVPNEPLQIEIIQTVQPPSPPQTDDFGLILDVDVFTIRGFASDDKALDDYLTKMHWLKNKAFFALVTKKAVKMLKEEKR